MRLDEVTSTKTYFIQKPCFGSTNDQHNDHKIDDQINDPITIINTMIISASLSISHYQIGNISLITFNYITSELVRLREGC